MWDEDALLALCYPLLTEVSGSGVAVDRQSNASDLTWQTCKKTCISSTLAAENAFQTRAFDAALCSVSRGPPADLYRRSGRSVAVFGAAGVKLSRLRTSNRSNNHYRRHVMAIVIHVINASKIRMLFHPGSGKSVALLLRATRPTNLWFW